MAQIVTLEGPKGAGKNYLQDLLKAKLEADNVPYEVVFLHEPGGIDDDVFGYKLRTFIKHGPNCSALTKFMLLQASRIEMFEKYIKPRLEDNVLFVLNRSIISSLVYQWMLEGVGEIINIHNESKGEYRLDHAFIIAPEKEILEQRLNTRSGNTDKLGSLIAVEDQLIGYQTIYRMLATSPNTDITKDITLLDQPDLSTAVPEIVTKLNELMLKDQEEKAHLDNLRAKTEEAHKQFMEGMEQEFKDVGAPDIDPEAG